MKPHLIVVGKLKNPEIEKLETYYLKQLRSTNIQIHEVKAYADNNKKEAQEVCKKIEDISKEAKTNIVLLCETGELHKDSFDFSHYYNELTQSKLTVFIIAGAMGPHNTLDKLATHKLSLSRLTFPHKIARLLLIEQIYRAHTIHIGHPYHN